MSKRLAVAVSRVCRRAAFGSAARVLVVCVASFGALSIGALVFAEEPEMRERHFEYLGHDIFYVEGGDGPPMIFLHNGGTSHRIWEKQMAHFAKRYHVYAADHLGFGRSAKPDIEYPFAIHYGQLEAFIEHIGESRVTLVGHCMGGAMALNYTARHPDRVERLILCNVYTERTLLAGSLAAMYRGLSSDKQALAAAEANALLSPPYEGYSDDPRVNVTLTRVIARADTYAVSDTLSLPEGMPPVLLIWGADNPILPLTAGEALRERMDFDNFTALAGCQHMAMIEKPEAFIEAMEAFLSESPTKNVKEAAAAN